MVNILLSSKTALLNPRNMIILKEYLKPNQKVMILGYSFFNKSINNLDTWNKFYEETNLLENLIANISQYGIKEQDITLINYFTSKKNEVLKKLSEVDILFLPGGSPDEMMQRIIEHKLLEHLKTFDKVIIGTSAGAMIQSDIFHISKDYDYKKYQTHQGLGYISFGIEVHFRKKRQQKKALRKAKYLHDILYVIPEESMIIQDSKSNTIRCYNNAKQYYIKQKIAK